MSSILLVEDDPNLAFAVKDHLEELGFDVTHAPNGTEGLSSYQATAHDLIIVDVMMPRMDGFSLVKKIRETDEFTPILFLTARSQEEDKLKGFEIGGDDYITKPFSIEELHHRIRVFLRRSGKPQAICTSKLHTFGKSTFDSQNLVISCNGETNALTQMEADLLLLLITHKNQLVKRSDILIKIWGEDDYFKGRSLDVFVSRLRKYLKSDSSLEIKNHHGVGFSLVDHEELS